jgi:hypothetical protein
MIRRRRQNASATYADVDVSVHSRWKTPWYQGKTAGLLWTQKFLGTKFAGALATRSPDR